MTEVDALREIIATELRKMVAGLGLHYDGSRSDVRCANCGHAERLHEHGHECQHHDDPKDQFSRCWCSKFEIPE